MHHVLVLPSRVILFCGVVLELENLNRSGHDLKADASVGNINVRGTSLNLVVRIQSDNLNAGICANSDLTTINVSSATSVESKTKLSSDHSNSRSIIRSYSTSAIVELTFENSVIGSSFKVSPTICQRSAVCNVNEI